MHTAAFIVALTLAPPPGKHHDNSWYRARTGAEAFSRVVVKCMLAALGSGATNAAAVASECIEATQMIWRASFPEACVVVAPDPKQLPPAP